MVVQLYASLVRYARTAAPVLSAFGVVTLIVLLARLGGNKFGTEVLASRLPWYLSRAAGISAYLSLTASTVLGLAIATRIADRWLSRPVVFTLHEQLAWLGLTATGLHVGALLMDSHISLRVADLLIPFASPYRPLAMALGIVSAYLVIAITGSFYIRARIGQRAWRLLHMASFATFALATGHGIMAGSSTSQPWMQWMYLLSGGTVLFLTNYRLLLPRRQRAATPGKGKGSGGQRVPPSPSAPGTAVHSG